MNQDEFYQEVKNLKGVSDKQMNNPQNVNFKKGGRYHWVQANNDFTEFQAKRAGKTFDECQKHSSFQSAIEWIFKIFNVGKKK